LGNRDDQIESWLAWSLMEENRGGEKVPGIEAKQILVLSWGSGGRSWTRGDSCSDTM
jgi:hypothetical protein